MTTERARPGPAPGTTDTAPEPELAPSVAWLAARIPDEGTRRRCRLVTQAYLEWSWADGGPASSRRSRFVPGASRRLQLSRAEVEYGLDRLAEHRAVVSRTLPVDG